MSGARPIARVISDVAAAGSQNHRQEAHRRAVVRLVAEQLAVPLLGLGEGAALLQREGLGDQLAGRPAPLRLLLPLHHAFDIIASRGDF